MKLSADEVVEVYTLLDQEKDTLKSHWQEIADYMIPRRQSVTTTQTMGSKRTTKVYESTATRSLRIFANGLSGHLSSPAYPWFELTTKDKYLAESVNVKFWLQDTTERLRNAINSSNAGLAMHEVYTDLGWGGTGCLYIEPGMRYTLNFQSFDMAVVCITEDAQGTVDGVYRLLKLSARQCIQFWGERCSQKIKKAYRENKYTEKFEIIHAVYPRDDYDWQKNDKFSMPYISRYIEKETKNELEESGYKEFPYCVPRWERDNNEVYGRSPAMDALPDVKMLNQERYDNTRARQKRIDPPLLAHKKSSLSSTRTSAGSVIFFDGEMRPESLKFDGDMRLAEVEENEMRQIIREHFYTDLFLLLAQGENPQKTATEIRELVEEKMVLLGPALTRLQSELFDPMLSRCFWILYRKGLILPVPEELMGEGLAVDYIGRLALAMKSTETRAAANTIQFAASLAQFNPSIMDNFNMDEIALGTAMRSGMPVKYLHPPDVREQIRQQRAQKEAEMQKSAELLETAKVLPGLGKAPETGSIQEALNG